MFELIKNSKFVRRCKQIGKVKHLRKQSFYGFGYGVITVEEMAAYMAPYDKMPAKQALKCAERDMPFFKADLLRH